MSFSRFVRRVALLGSASLLVAACSDSPTGVAGEAPVGAIALSDSVFTKGLVFQARVIPPAGYRVRSGTPRWSVVSGSAAIAAIDGSSDSVTVTLTGAGTVQLRAAYSLAADGVGSVLGIAGPTRRTSGDADVEAVRTLTVASPALVYTVVPTATATAGVTLGGVRVEVRDVRGRVMTASTDSIAITLDPTSGTAGAALLGTAGKRAVAGVATFPDLVIQRAGSGYRLIAASPTVAIPDTAPTTIVAAAASAAQSTITVADSVRTVGTTTTVTVTVKDAFGNPVLTATPATLGSAATTGTLGAFTCSNGVCTATYTAPTAPASAGITATIGGTAVAGAPRPVSVVAGPAAKLVITGDTVQTAGVAQAVLVRALDAFGNPATSYTGTKTVTFSGATASPTGTNPTAASAAMTTVATLAFVNGTATAPMTLFRAETATIAVTDGTLTTTGTDRLTVRVVANAPDASQTTYEVLETTETVGGTLIVRVTVKDAYGNVVTTAKDTDFSVTPSAGTLGGFTCTNGVCTATYTAPTTPGTPSFTAKVGTTSIPGTTPTVTVSPGAPDPTTSTLAIADSVVTVGGTTTVTVTLRDQYGNLVTTAGPSAFAGLATIGGLGAFTCVNAVCTATYTGSTIGTASLTATIGGVGMLGSPGTIRIAPGAAARLVITGSATQTAGVPQTITITARDAGNNVATGYTGAKSLNFSGASIAPDGTTNPTVGTTNFGTGTSVTFTNGVATVSLTLVAAEVATVATTDGTIAAAGSDRLSVTVAAAAADVNASDIAASPSTLQANGTAKAVITIQLKDAFGNPTAILPTQGGSAGTLSITPSGTGTLLATLADSGGGRHVQEVQAPSAAGTGSFSITLNGVTGTKAATVTYVAAGGVLSRIVCTTSQPAGQSAASSTTVNLCAATAPGDLELVTLALDGVDDISAPAISATNGTWVKISSTVQSTGTGGNKSMLLILYARRFQSGNARTVTFTGLTNHKWSVDMVTFLSSGSALPSATDVSKDQNATGSGLATPGLTATAANTVVYYVLGNSLTGNVATPTPNALTALANNNTGGTSSTSFVELLANGATAPARTWASSRSANSVVVQLLVRP